MVLDCLVALACSRPQTDYEYGKVAITCVTGLLFFVGGLVSACHGVGYMRQAEMPPAPKCCDKEGRCK